MEKDFSMPADCVGNCSVPHEKERKIFGEQVYTSYG